MLLIIPKMTRKHKRMVDLIISKRLKEKSIRVILKMTYDLSSGYIVKSSYQ